MIPRAAWLLAAVLAAGPVLEDFPEGGGPTPMMLAFRARKPGRA